MLESALFRVQPESLMWLWSVFVTKSGRETHPCAGARIPSRGKTLGEFHSVLTGLCERRERKRGQAGQAGSQSAPSPDATWSNVRARKEQSRPSWLQRKEGRSVEWEETVAKNIASFVLCEGAVDICYSWSTLRPTTGPANVIKAHLKTVYTVQKRVNGVTHINLDSMS